MNKIKLSNPVRLIAFFLTAALLISTFGFTVDGWQIGNKGEKSPFDGPFSSPNDGENTTTNRIPEKPEIYIPAYVNRLTGVETSEIEALKGHLAFIMDPSISSYGISRADLLCEIPTENGERYIAFISNTDNLSKIGSLTPTRGYISNIAKYFGSICLSVGNDDSIKYTHCNMSDTTLDLSDGGYYYSEFTSNLYTNCDLLNMAITNQETWAGQTNTEALPFDYVDFGLEPIIFESITAQRITVNNESSLATEMRYSTETRRYILYKDSMPKIDSLNGKELEFTNCFVLFADSVTYDNTECSQMVMDTIGQGKGYYFTSGGVIEIYWVGTEEGSLSFYALSGEKLIVNRGKSFISFVKSSKIENVRFQ